MENRACGEGRSCALHVAWEEGQEAILSYLAGHTLADFAAQAPPPEP